MKSKGENNQKKTRQQETAHAREREGGRQRATAKEKESGVGLREGGVARGGFKHAPEVGKDVTQSNRFCCFPKRVARH